MIHDTRVAAQPEPLSHDRLMVSVNLQDSVSILRQEPKTAEDYYDQGLMLHNQGRFDQAIDKLKYGLLPTGRP
ncbi:MAG: hypothetical protein HC852_10015, partial [Acaryochloridaceae cyanobacterium RU_4_10]|nr:hypothetical protein [Acaryochloridaceae cyanobacterium RU_4_10]